MTLTHKLLGSMFLVGLLPLIVYGFVTQHKMNSTLEKSTFDHLGSLSMIKKKQVEDFFQTIRYQFLTLAENTMVIESMEIFTSAFTELTVELNPEQPEIKQYRKSLSEYYEKTFTREYLNKNGKPVESDSLIPCENR